jgi:hypothetical protein
LTLSFGRRVIALARARGVAGFSLTIAMSGALVAMSVLDTTLPGRRLVDACCAVRASEPMHVELARLIGSIFAPAPHLPLWGSVLQVVVVVGLAELLLGWRWVLVAGLACHVAATLAARGIFAIEPHHLGAVALPLSMAAERDTGPSALTVGLAASLVVRERLRSLTVVYVICVATATLLAATSVAGVEHLVAAGVGMLLGLAGREWYGVVSGQAAIRDLGADLQAVWRSQTFAEASKGRTSGSEPL